MSQPSAGPLPQTGSALAAPQGLVVPVIRGAERLRLAEIAAGSIAMGLGGYLAARTDRDPKRLTWTIDKAKGDYFEQYRLAGDAPGWEAQRWTRTLRVPVTTLDALIGKYGAPAFIKIDVEGHEPAVLRGLHRPVPYVSFEVNLPEFRSEGEECIELLGALAPGEFNYVVNCQHGLRLQTWADKSQFLGTFARCAETSIEVFWHVTA